MTDNTAMEGNESPVPAMTISITPIDAARVLDAGKALAKCVATIKHRNEELDKGEKKSVSSPTPNNTSSDDDPMDTKNNVPASESGADVAEDRSSLKPSSIASKEDNNHRLHDMLLEAAQICKNPLISSFPIRMRAAGASRKEIGAGILLFHDLGKTAKLKNVFEILCDEKRSNSQRQSQGIENTEEINGSDKAENVQPQASLDREGTVSLFRSVVMSISICLYSESSIGTARLEKPAKMPRQSVLSPASVTAKSDDDTTSNGFPTCQSPSFDNSMCTLRDEDDRDHPGLPEKVKNEIEEIAIFAAERLIDFARKRIPKGTANAITFDAFGDWYNFGGCTIVPWLELLDLSKWKPASPQSGRLSRLAEKAVFPAVQEKTPNPEGPSETVLPKFHAVESPSSRVLVSFDFTGAGGSKLKVEEGEHPMCISITEGNLVILKDFVHRTGISSQPPADICKSLLRYASKHTKMISREAFRRFVRDIVFETSGHLSSLDVERFKNFFDDFFTCFATVSEQPTGADVNVMELAVGISVLCSGNKSTKLVIGFELLDDNRRGSLAQGQLNQYIRSYLTMLVAISLLTDPGKEPSACLLSEKRRVEMHDSVRNGARWTLGHFLKSSGSAGASIVSAQYSFETFAEWYTSGGYNIAPWLELLDLTKMLSLIGDDPPKQGGTLSALRGSARHDRKSGGLASPHSEVLFTFPLANRRSLVVLRNDATYVRSVVEKLGLLSLSAEDVWSTLSSKAWQSSKSRKADNGVKSVFVDEQLFVRCMEEVVKTTSAGRKRKLTGSLKSQEVRETLANFFQSFDLEQIGRVGLNELMGGLTLLCGGKKSTKLAFAFSVFDSNFQTKSDDVKNESGASLHSLNGREMFLFLRSFLIVMFSCCQQSLDLSADDCNRYINDTAGTVADDVMRFRNHSRKRDRVDFDDFGEWYNEGGFETAPWLELLDLKKWVLVDNFDALENHAARPPVGSSNLPLTSRVPPEHGCPPPPPDEAIDHTFFSEDYPGIMPIDSMDEMDFILMQQPSQDKENDSFPTGKISMSFSYSPDTRPHQSRDRHTSSLKFHVVTDDDHGGYMLSLSQKRIRHLRKLLVESGLHTIDAESACHKIISKASPAPHRSGVRGDHSSLVLTKSDFDSAMRSVVSGGTGKAKMSLDTQKALSDLLACIFTSFDRDQTGSINAMEVACGFTVLCRGKKSDKLEFAFEVLDKDKDGLLSRAGMGDYLRSFLTVLLSVAVTSALDFDPSEDNLSTMAGNVCERAPGTVFRAVSGGAKWAANQAFKATAKAKKLPPDEFISFDDFAEWYTNVGYSCIPWLELLDLRKWVITDS